MQLLINTDAKTVTMYGNANLKELLEFMQEKFPDDWGEFKMEPQINTIEVPIYPSQPGIIPCSPYEPVIQPLDSPLYPGQPITWPDEQQKIWYSNGTDMTAITTESKVTDISNIAGDKE